MVFMTKALKCSGVGEDWCGWDMAANLSIAARRRTSRAGHSRSVTFASGAHGSAVLAGHVRAGRIITWSTPLQREGCRPASQGFAPELVILVITLGGSAGTCPVSVVTRRHVEQIEVV